MPTERNHVAYLTFWLRLVSAALTGNHRTVSTGGTTRVMPVPEVKFCLVFQCETLSIPVMRRVLGDHPEQEAFYRSRVPSNRFATPEQVADVVAHLAGPHGILSNGTVYAMDGGLTAGSFEAPDPQ